MRPDQIADVWRELRRKPLSAATLGSHWSLMRSRIHYPSDIIAGGFVAMVVSAATWKLWPPRPARGRPPTALAANAHNAPASGGSESVP